MIFTELELEGAYLIELEKIGDERGFFARAWCKNEFEDLGLNTNLTQCNISFNEKKGTLRGLHFQSKPYEEDKIVRCINGKIYDVIVDLRAKSKTFGKWIGIELSSENRKMLYIPKGFAHGFITLEDNTEVFYQMTEFYYDDYASGVFWNDKDLNIDWNLHKVDRVIVSEKDSKLQSFKEFCNSEFFKLDE